MVEVKLRTVPSVELSMMVLWGAEPPESVNQFCCDFFLQMERFEFWLALDGRAQVESVSGARSDHKYAIKSIVELIQE